MPPILDGLPEGLARLESRDLLSPYPHRLSGLGVPTFPRLLLPDVELPEARQLDLLARLERFRYGRGERFQVFFGLALGGVGVLYHPLYEPLLVHGCLTPCSMVFTLRVLPSAGGRANTRDAAIIFRRTPLGRSSQKKPLRGSVNRPQDHRRLYAGGTPGIALAAVRCGILMLSARRHRPGTGAPAS